MVKRIKKLTLAKIYIFFWTFWLLLLPSLVKIIKKMQNVFNGVLLGICILCVIKLNDASEECVRLMNLKIPNIVLLMSGSVMCMFLSKKTHAFSKRVESVEKFLRWLIIK